MKIFVTGGAGYIASHTIIDLIEAGHVVVIADNFSNSSPESLKRIEQITGNTIQYYDINLCDKKSTQAVFSSHDFDAVIHFAGLKAVGESIKKPIEYYRNNIDSTLSLLEAMRDHTVKKLIFSSSATVYGEPESLPLTENSRVGVGITNPYGQTKFMIEQILRDVSVANPEFEVTLLRYFNPVGAHKSGRIGEDPNGLPTNILPYITQVAVGKLDKVHVFGGDWNTSDGTGVRDYIHVVDLARGHVAALEHSKPGVHTYNLSTGKGTSVLELIAAVSKAANKEVPYTIVDRRPGDVASCYASPEKANKELGWKAQYGISEACEDAWRWQSQNPDGFNTST